MSKSKTETKTITIPLLPVQHVTIVLEGLTPLLSNRLHPSVVQKIKESQEKKAKNKTKIQNLQEHYDQSLWRVGKDAFGIQVSALISAWNSAFRWIEGMNMTATRGLLSLDKACLYGDELDATPCVEVVSTEGPQWHERPIKVGTGKNKSAQIKVCGVFDVPWSICLIAKFDDKTMTLEQFLLAWQIAGDRVGIGGYRPECSGTYGKFELAQAA